MNRDLALGGIAFAVASGYYLIAAAIPPSLLADAVGPQGLPKTYGVLLAGLSLILGIRSLRFGREIPSVRGIPLQRDLTARGTLKQLNPAEAGSHVQPPRIERQKLLRVAGLLAIGAAYVVVVPWLGYMLSLAALITATTYYQGGALNREVVLVAVSGSILLWLLFVMLLGIPQPPGFWPSLSQMSQMSSMS